MPYNSPLPKGGRNTDGHKDFDANVHSSFINNGPKLEGTQIPISWGMDKQIVTYSYNEILLNNNKRIELWPTDYTQQHG